MRLNKFLASAGVASRRGADALIGAGKVRINGKQVHELGTIVDNGDCIEVDGKRVAPPAAPTYLLLNKPRGVVTTLRDPQGRPTVAQFVAGRSRVFPVGRLDYATSGVLLLTDDGDLAHGLLHPRFGVEKTYRAEISGRLSPQDVRSLLQGVFLDDGRAAGAKLRVLAAAGDRCVVEVTIHEGRNRQVRRMFEALGHPVRALTRTRFGPLRLGELAPGQIRTLTSKEIDALQRYRRRATESPRTTPPEVTP
ncbi:MAG TPA: pseudouridine synthase [Candidatus Cybelea sp.]|nr:pseudouridine synthase [Candidatus Cybelea sp.]